MKHYLFLIVLMAFMLFVFCMALAGCSTENPLCTDNYCVTGEIYAKTDLAEDATFDTLPGTVNEDKLIQLLTVDVGEYEFESITVTGRVDWNFDDEDWEYTENNVTYIKKLVIEFESDDGEFGANRSILVHLNTDTVVYDANFVEHVDLFGTESINLTHHIGMAEYNGDIVGAPTK